jgi:hypothetical protein
MQSKHPLFRHCEHMEQTLFLIREQLKSRRFFNALRSLGLGDSNGEVHLEALILYAMNLDNGSDEVMNFIEGMMDRYSQELSHDVESIDKAAVEVYCELLKRARMVAVSQEPGS